jgi:hypothetical protein
VFRDRKVLLTQSRNNELQWIHDWVHFFARKHGCDAVLLYDNASTNYDADCLQNVILSIPGIEIGLVVRWPYKYGPPGSERHHPIKIPWDSNYSQIGVLQHARHRFLSHAQAVVNADVDELVITRDKSSVFDLVTGSDTGYLRYTGRWIEGVTESASETCRHLDFFYRDAAPSEPLMPKWAVAPRRCPDQARWLPHKVENMKPDRVSASVTYRHFRAISTSWKYSRGSIEPPNDVQHVKDEDLIEWMEVLKLSKWEAWTKDLALQLQARDQEIKTLQLDLQVLDAETRALTEKLSIRGMQLHGVLASSSWKLTRPVRRLARGLVRAASRARSR